MMVMEPAWAGDLLVMRYVSPALTLVHIYGEDEVLTIRMMVLNHRMRSQSNGMKTAAERCNSLCEIRKKCWYRRRWNVYVAHKFSARPTLS